MHCLWNYSPKLVTSLLKDWGMLLAPRVFFSSPVKSEAWLYERGSVVSCLWDELWDKGPQATTGGTCLTGSHSPCFPLCLCTSCALSFIHHGAIGLSESAQDLLPPWRFQKSTGCLFWVTAALTHKWALCVLKDVSTLEIIFIFSGCLWLTTKDSRPWLNLNLVS